MNEKNMAMVLVMFLGVSGFGAPTPKCDVLPRPENVVTVPGFSDSKQCEEETGIDEPLQYEPANEDTPLFREQESPEEYADGSLYRLGLELYIDPQPDYVSTREPISEPMPDDLSKR